MKNYYFLVASLPEIHLGSHLDLSWNALVTLLEENLASEDLAPIRAIRRYYDIENIRSLLNHHSFQRYGNFNKVQLEEAWLMRLGLPSYINAFFDRYPKREDCLSHLPELISLYFTEEEKTATGLLKNFLKFERDLRLVFVGFRSKKLGRNVLQELQFEDSSDDLVAQIIAQKDHPSYELPLGFEGLKPFFEDYENAPLMLFQELQRFRFQKITEMIGIDMLTIDCIVGYVIQFIIAEKWLELDKHKGSEILHTLLKEAT